MFTPSWIPSMTVAAGRNLPPIQAENLAGISGVAHGFFGREGGVSNGLYASLNCGWGSNDDPDNVRENRRRAARRLQLGADGILTLYQVHGATAFAVSETIPRDQLPKADAIVTTTKGLAIGVLTADCAPLLLADPNAGVIAAAHAGWRGAVGGIVEAVVAKMVEMGAKPFSIRAAVGPAISLAAYEVGPEFEAEVTSKDPSSADFFRQPNPGARTHFDLPRYVGHRLTKAGVGSIHVDPACTHENESRFFSFRRSTQRREPDYGRQISAIVLL